MSQTDIISYGSVTLKVDENPAYTSLLGTAFFTYLPTTHNTFTWDCSAAL